MEEIADLLEKGRGEGIAIVGQKHLPFIGESAIDESFAFIDFHLAAFLYISINHFQFLLMVRGAFFIQKGDFVFIRGGKKEGKGHEKQ